MRRHGCQTPFHSLQIATWIMGSVLGASFYLLVIPRFASYVGHILSGCYAFIASSCIICGLAATCIDSSDEGLLLKKEADQQEDAAIAVAAAAGAASPSAITELKEGDLSDEKESSRATMKAEKVAAAGKARHKKKKKSQETTMVNPFGESRTELVYCYICQANVGQTSAHCRFCDKCVANFDHHCKWLNTCIGRRNYAWFLGTVTAAFVLTLLQATLTVFIIVCYGMHGRSFIEKVESYLPHIPVQLHIALLALTGVILVPTIILIAQLLIFHMMLKYEGMTTYEYVVRETRRQRAREEKAAAARELEAMARQTMQGAGRLSWGGGIAAVERSRSIGSSTTASRALHLSYPASSAAGQQQQRHVLPHPQHHHTGVVGAGASPLEEEEESIESMVCTSARQPAASSSSHVIPLDPLVAGRGPAALPTSRTEGPLFSAPP